MESSFARNVLQGRDGSYALLEVIGKGAYGTVYKGIWREVGRHVAIKRVARSRLSADENRALQAEIQLFKNLNDMHIVNYIEAVDDPKSEYLDIVMEFVEGGSLYSIVQSIRKSLEKGARVFDEPVVANFVRQVVLGLRYLHRQGVVHRDIKGANILVTKESHVKLADFGVSSTKPGSDLSTPSSPIDVAGSPYWMAPEIITLSGSTTACDIWSLGCTVIELMTGFPPYHELSDVTALFRIVSDDCPPLPPNLSSDCEDFLRKCLNKDMHTRASADELLNHRWLTRGYGGEAGALSGQNTVTQERRDEGLQPSTGGRDGKGLSTLMSGPGGISGQTQAMTLGKYEEDDDEDFDDLDFGERDSNGVETSGLFNNSGGGADAEAAIETSTHSTGDVRSTLTVASESLRSDAGYGQGRLSIREDPFKDLMDDPEVDREREWLRKQKEQWALVKIQAASLGQSEDTHIAACEALVEMFRVNPEQRYYLIYDPGLLPIIEVLESGGNGSARVVEAMLRVTLSLLDDNEGANQDEAFDGTGGVLASSNGEVASFGYPRVSNIREDLCLAGILPVMIRYCRRTESTEARILSARFLEKILQMETALHMFIACRGFEAFVDMLEPDILVAGDLARIALVGIDRMLSMENQRHKRDFCRRFAWSGLLDRIVNGISHNIDCLQRMHDEHKWERETRSRLERHVIKLARLLQTFAARADPTVKSKMVTHTVLHPIIRQITNKHTSGAAVQSILCCIRDLSRDPQTHLALQQANAIETLVEYLSIDVGADTKSRYFIISSLHDLCIVSPGRQEAAAKAGLVPHLQRYIRSQDNLMSLCIDMYSGLACAGPVSRTELSKHQGVGLYIELLLQLSIPGTVRKWQARVLQSLAEWLDDDAQCESVENELVLEENRIRVCQSLAQTRISDMEGLLEPYLKIVTISGRVNEVFGSNRSLVSSMVRWLESMYDESDAAGRGGPRGRLLLLRTLLVHARLWTGKSDIDGLIAALRLLLTEVVLVTDEAITVREQASLLLSALDRTGVGIPT